MADNAHILAKIDELNTNVQRMNKKLEDLPVIKSALLHLLSIYNQSLLNASLATSNLQDSLMSAAAVGGQSDQSVSNALKRQIQKLNVPPTNVKNVLTSNSVTAIVEPGKNLYSDGDSLARLVSSRTPTINPADHDHGHVSIVENSLLDSGPNSVNIGATATVNNKKHRKRFFLTEPRVFLTDDERTMMYNIHTIFGAQRASHVFGFKPKNVVAQVAKYRTLNNVSSEDQMSLREMVRSVKNFERLIWKSSSNGDNQNFDESGNNVSEKTIDINMDYSDGEASDNNADQSQDDGLGLLDESGNPIPFRGNRLGLRRPMNLPKTWSDEDRRQFLASMSSKTFMADFLREHFDYETYCIQKALDETTPGRRRFTTGGESRRHKFTEEEKRALYEMYEREGSVRTAQFFNSSPKTVRQMAYCYRKRLTKGNFIANN